MVKCTKKRRIFSQSDAHVRKIDAPAPPMFYGREIVLNMYVKFSSSGVQAKSGADMKIWLVQERLQWMSHG